MLEPPRIPVPVPLTTSAPPGDGEEGQSAPRSCELWDVAQLQGWELSLFSFSAVKDLGCQGRAWGHPELPRRVKPPGWVTLILGSRKRGQQRGSSSLVPAWRESLSWAARRGVCRGDPLLATLSCSLFFQPCRMCFKEVLRQKYPLIPPPRKKGVVKLSSSICSSLTLTKIIHRSWWVEIAVTGQQPQEFIACNVPVRSQG